MISVVVIGQTPGSFEACSEEARWATHMLSRSLPDTATRITSRESGLDALIPIALKAAREAGVDGCTEVLLLAHSQMVPVPGSLKALEEALSRGATAACAFDSSSPPLSPISYFTYRGMERYVGECINLPDSPFNPLGTPVFAILTQLDALQDGRWASAAVRVPAAYFHDFSGYRSGRREEISPLVPLSARSILDVGGGEGAFLGMIKERQPCRTYLSEMSASACRIAAETVDTVWEGDFLSAPIVGTFDCITFLDVLEHAINPTAMLKRAASLLDSDGCIVASIPNVGHWSVVADLLEGRWDYVPAGLHCITHLRFFTRRGIEELMHDSGLSIESITPALASPPDWFTTGGMSPALKIDLDCLATQAYFVVARKAA